MILLVLAVALGGSWAVYRHPAWGLWLFWAAVAWGWVFGDAQAPVLVLGRVSIYALDAASGLLFGAALLRAAALWGPASLWREKGLLLLGLLLALALVAGVQAYGLKAAGLDARRFFALYAPLLFAAVFLELPGLAETFLRTLLAAALFLLILALFRWGLVAMGQPHEAWAISTLSRHKAYFRVLDSAQTLVLGQVALLFLAAGRMGAGRWTRDWLPWVSLAMVVALQHRTVWLACLAGSAVLLRFDPRAKAVLRSRALWLSVAAAGVAALLFRERLGGLLAALLESFHEAFGTEKSTLLWRLQGWAELLAPKALSPGQWLVGKPFGTPYLRLMYHGLTEVTPHSQYVHWLLRTGLVGVCAWLALWRRAWRQPGALRPLAFLVATQMVYGLAYGLVAEQGLLLGWLLVLARSGRPVR